ncbi:MAG: caspase family protein [Bacteroidota bacterium]
MNDRLISPTRKGILIGSPGSGRNRLRGVANDMINKHEFMLSPRGGVWRKNEISVLDNPTIVEVITEVHSSCADFQEVYYSGHGCQDEAGNEFICLQDGNLSVDYLFNQNGPRQFAILDSCRKYYATISGFPKEVERRQYATGYSEARAAFDNYILNSPSGKMIMYATGTGDVAIDNRDGHGGEFTLALLKGIYSIEATQGIQPVFPAAALQNAKRILLESGHSQIPELINLEGALNIPLGLASPDFLQQDIVLQHRQQIMQQMAQSKQQNTAETAIGVALIGLVLWGLSK